MSLESKLISEYGRDNFQRQVDSWQASGYKLDATSYKATQVKDDKTGQTYILHTGVMVLVDKSKY